MAEPDLESPWPSGDGRTRFRVCLAAFQSRLHSCQRLIMSQDTTHRHPPRIPTVIVYHHTLHTCQRHIIFMRWSCLCIAVMYQDSHRHLFLERILTVLCLSLDRRSVAPSLSKSPHRHLPGYPPSSSLERSDGKRFAIVRSDGVCREGTRPWPPISCSRFDPSCRRLGLRM